MRSVAVGVGIGKRVVELVDGLVSRHHVDRIVYFVVACVRFGA